MEREGDGGELKGTMEHKKDWDRKKRKITDSKLVTSVFISLFKEHMPLPSSAMGERNRRWDLWMRCLPAILMQYSQSTPLVQKKSIQENLSKKKRNIY